VALERVEAYARHLTNSGTFDSTTAPTLDQVQGFITDGYNLLNSLLARYGYGTAQTDTEVVAALQPYNVFYAVAQVELCQPSVGGRPAEETRWYQFQKLFETAEEFVSSPEFARLGATVDNRALAQLAVGGVSIDRMDTVEDDSDRVIPAFTRKRHTYRGQDVTDEILREQ
jgi:N-acetyl-anhydromuramyl-L-alanine amidase AmpD